MIHDIRYVPASPEDRVTGLLGYVAFTIGGLRFDGVTVRRTVDGRYTLSFPERRDSSGKSHPTVRPITPAVRAVIEAAVLGELNKRGFIVLPREIRGAS